MHKTHTHTHTHMCIYIYIYIYIYISSVFFFLDNKLYKIHGTYIKVVETSKYTDTFAIGRKYP
jgi:hypothetical protein